MTIANNEVVVPIALAIGGGGGFPLPLMGGKVPITICIVGGGMPIVIGGGVPGDGAYSWAQ